jgi:protein TonB
MAAMAALHASDSDNRILWIGVAASMALHAAVLWLFPGLRQSTPPAVTVLTATITPRAAAPERREPVTQAPAPKPVEPRPHAQPKPVPAPPEPVLTRPTPEPSAPSVAQEPPAPPPPVPKAPVAPPAPPVASVPPAAAPVPPAPRAEQPSAPAAPAATTNRAGDAADAGTLDQYRLALIGMARKYKRYPSQAMERGWTGKVEVRLVIGANGNIASALVKTSSGYDVLDNQALDMIKKAKPITPIPPALRGREFSVDIPVIFDLRTG